MLDILTFWKKMPRPSSCSFRDQFADNRGTDKNRSETAKGPHRDLRCGPCYQLSGFLALTCLETALRLVDDVDAALAAHNTAIAVALLERTQRVPYFHRSHPLSRRGDCALGYSPARGPMNSWWAVLGSNQWPLRCQRSALPLS